MPLNKKLLILLWYLNQYKHKLFLQNKDFHYIQLTFVKCLHAILKAEFIKFCLIFAPNLRFYVLLTTSFNQGLL